MALAFSDAGSGQAVSRTTVFLRPGRIEATAGALAQQPPAGELVLDLAGVPFVGSGELTALVTLNQRVRAAGGSLRLVNVEVPVAGALAASRLDLILEVKSVKSVRVGAA